MAGCAASGGRWQCVVATPTGRGRRGLCRHLSPGKQASVAGSVSPPLAARMAVVGCKPTLLRFVVLCAAVGLAATQDRGEDEGENFLQTLYFAECTQLFVYS